MPKNGKFIIIKSSLFGDPRFGLLFYKIMLDKFDYKYSDYHNPHRPSMIPDRPIDFIDEIVEINKIARNEMVDEEVDYLLPGENGKNDQLIPVKTRLSKMHETNPFVRRLLSFSRADESKNIDPDPRPAKTYIAKEAITAEMKQIGAPEEEIENIRTCLEISGSSEFVSLAEMLELCHHATNIAFDNEEHRKIRLYDTLARSLRRKHRPKPFSNIIHLTLEDIQEMKKKGIDPDHCPLQQIKNFLNQKTHDKK